MLHPLLRFVAFHFCLCLVVPETNAKTPTHCRTLVRQFLKKNALCYFDASSNDCCETTSHARFIALSLLIAHAIPRANLNLTLGIRRMFRKYNWLIITGFYSVRSTANQTIIFMTSLCTTTRQKGGATVR